MEIIRLYFYKSAFGSFQFHHNKLYFVYYEVTCIFIITIFTFQCYAVLINYYMPLLQIHTKRVPRAAAQTYFDQNSELVTRLVLRMVIMVGKNSKEFRFYKKKGYTGLLAEIIKWSISVLYNFFLISKFLFEYGQH